jgi:type II secretory pathway pseudopilin PulG
LLAVIAIIAILAAMLLRALATANEKGIRFAPLTHFEQIGLAVTPWNYN